MALPQDGQNANGLTKVTEIPKGKELIFIDPTTNEGGIITLEDLTTQILNKLTSKIFTLDQGNITLIEALNKLNSKPQITEFSGNIDSLNGRCVVVATANATGTLPKDLSGNRFLILCDSVVNPNGIIYGVQMALSFGPSNIAVRNCDFNNVGSASYGSWRYI